MLDAGIPIPVIEGLIRTGQSRLQGCTVERNLGSRVHTHDEHIHFCLDPFPIYKNSPSIIANLTIFSSFNIMMCHGTYVRAEMQAIFC